MISALRLPYFAAALECQAHPQFVGRPLALARPNSARSLFAVSREAEAQGIVAGMSLVGAQALCPDLHIIRRHPATLRCQFEMVLEVLTDFSDHIEAEDALPRVRQRGRPLPHPHPAAGSDQPPALCTLEVGKLTPESGMDLLLAVGQFIHRHFDLNAALSLAQDKFTARTAALALKPGEVLVIEDSAAFLANGPIHLLPADGELLRQFQLLGLDTLGQLAALPTVALEQRFGTLGRDLQRLACGQDSSPVRPYTPLLSESRSLTFEGPIRDRGGLEQALRDVLADLSHRLRARGQVAGAMGLRFELDDGHTLEDLRPLHPPTADACTLTATARGLWAEWLLPYGVTGLEVTLDQLTGVVPRQLSLFDRPPLSDRVLRKTLQRLLHEFEGSGFYHAQLVDPEARLPEDRVRFDRWDAA